MYQSFLKLPYDPHFPNYGFNNVIDGFRSLAFITRLHILASSLVLSKNLNNSEDSVADILH
jgi:hypothetical protein